MFSRFSNNLRSILIDELSETDESRVNVPDNQIANILTVGVVKWVFSEVPGELPLVVISGDYAKNRRLTEGSLVKFTDGQVAICCSMELLFKNVDLIAIFAHEIGHYLQNHLNAKQGDIPNKYIKQNRKAIRANNQTDHVYWGTRAIVEGGYLVREYEADEIAVRFVGVNRLIALHTLDALQHPNALVAIEKMNRMKAIIDKYGDDFHGNPGFTIEAIIYKKDPENEQV